MDIVVEYPAKPVGIFQWSGIIMNQQQKTEIQDTATLNLSIAKKTNDP